MKAFFTIIILLSLNLKGFGQELKTVNRPDGITMKYFNPVPVAVSGEFEAELSLYKNVTNNFYMLSLTVLFKSGIPTKLSGDLLIQATGTDGHSLEPIMHRLPNINGRQVALSLFLLEERDIRDLRDKKLKSLGFNIHNQLIGMSISRNKDILIRELSKL